MARHAIQDKGHHLEWIEGHTGHRGPMSMRNTVPHSHPHHLQLPQPPGTSSATVNSCTRHTRSGHTTLLPRTPMIISTPPRGNRSKRAGWRGINGYSGYRHDWDIATMLPTGTTTSLLSPAPTAATGTTSVCMATSPIAPQPTPLSRHG